MAVRVLVAAGVLCAMSAPALAGGFGIPEIGVRRTGMATIIGRPDDASAIYHNPAGLILSPGTGLYLSMGLAMISTEFRLAPWEGSTELLGVEPDAEGYYPAIRPTRAMGVIPMLAATYEILPDKLVAGAALYVGNATGAAFGEGGVTRYHLIDGYVVAPQAVLAASYRVHPTLSLGASVGVIHLRVHGQREVFPILNGTDVRDITGTRPRLELDGQGWAPSWIVGAYGQPHPRVSWGATITGRVDAELEGPVEVTFSEDAGNPGDKLIGRQTTTQLLPWAFMAGANVDVSDHVELGSEFRYWLYRQYDRQHTEIVGIQLLRELETIKNYTDSWAASVGVRVHSLAAAPALDLMAGLQYDKSPAPARTVTLDQPSFTHPAAHAGVRYDLGRVRLGASWVHYWYRIPVVTDSLTMPPSNFRGHGSNNIVTLSVEARL